VSLSDVLKSGTGLFLARFLIDFRRGLLVRLLKRANHVLVGQILTTQGVAQLRKIAGGAKITLHHNGEPADFERKWSTYRTHTALPNYEAYLGAFDSVLFQNEGQMLDFRERRANLEIFTTVIWPACDEKSALEGRNAPSPYEPGTEDLVCVAKFQTGKRQLELIQAFQTLTSEFPSARLHLVGSSASGEPNYLKQCWDYVQSNSLTRKVTFWGYRSDAMRFIAHAQALVLFSQGEGTSRAMREAAFLGTPIVATLLGGSHSFLGEKGALWIRDSNVAGAMRHTLKSPSARQAAARAASERYKQLASWDKFSAASSEFFAS
jgi:glycosyltransferase involved in cell wall biosynthesis